MSIYVVQGLLGHANVRATQRYAHLANETLSDAAWTRLSYHFVRNRHLETAFRYRLELKAGLGERLDDALSGLLPRSHDILLDAVNGPLGDRCSPCKLGLAPAQHRPARSDLSSELHEIGQFAIS